MRRLQIGCRLSKSTSRKDTILPRKRHIGFDSPHLKAVFYISNCDVPKLSLPLRASEVALCAVKLLRSEVCFASVLGQTLLHFCRKGKYFTVIYYNFTSNQRFETSQKDTTRKRIFRSSSGGFVLFRSFYRNASLSGVSVSRVSFFRSKMWQVPQNCPLKILFQLQK